ncbi:MULTISPECIES: aspartate kinase [unclassified Paenibacillus]|uniref:aspartate kinase n=1 Tax=unclassified Paenibacillus TaxID=185978 RepID=UPI001AE283BD|nr:MULTISPECIES: aspartate kinase [unclassified Paenibacillus]MBP1155950.1 aspartate kinase [Paenibacillus sp. PvP091]MBP1168664.1 aspartate kinase [Paenibacillus sp. PvR098]MBP2439692.1 aspartate kinase [Paenibacillus sp. PvP052]
MKIMVQKFGGTSLSTVEARAHVIEHIQDALKQEYKLVVVVSAMGRKGEPYATDTLLEWIHQNGDSLPDREKDILLCCGELISAATLCSLLNATGVPASALTGAQAGIQTNDVFGNAQIASVKPERILGLLEQGNVVIVAGFQGETADGDFTTLGRGGSDTSATALGAALKAEIVDIFTDVGGILTADPRIVADAQPLPVVSYMEICNMAHLGAKVIHPRAVEIAMHAGIPVRVRSTFSKDPGTLVTHSDAIKGEAGSVHDRFVTGIAHVPGISQIRVSAKEGSYDLQLNVFKAMARQRISVDFINVNPSGVVYTVFDYEANRAANTLMELGLTPQITSNCAKVSIIGGGMNGVPGIMAHIVEALTEEDVQILQSADSNATIWVLVQEEDMAKAVRALHKQFKLHRTTK